MNSEECREHDESSLRLRRLARLFTASPVYFITACTHERHPVLANADVHEAFHAFAENAAERGAWVGRYVIMPDHIHLFVAIDAPLEFSRWVKSLKNTLSKALRTRGTPAPHWQKGFFDHVLRSTESYSEKWRYMADNPLRAGLVADGDEWIYSGEIHPLRWQGREL